MVFKLVLPIRVPVRIVLIVVFFSCALHHHSLVCLSQYLSKASRFRQHSRDSIWSYKVTIMHFYSVYVDLSFNFNTYFIFLLFLCYVCLIFFVDFCVLFCLFLFFFSFLIFNFLTFLFGFIHILSCVCNTKENL